MSIPVSGATRLACILGDPIRHSLSPAIHNAAFEAVGLDWIYLAFQVPPTSLAEAVAGLRALDVGGASVTMPLKRAIVPMLDRLSEGADALGAANTVVNQEGVLVGHNTDGEGFMRFLAEAGITAGGTRVLLLGAGGAARAVSAALGAAGATVVVAARRGDAAAEGARLAGGRGSACTWDERTTEAARADLVVNATPVTSPLDDVRSLRPGTVVVDLIYGRQTPLLESARAAGLAAHDGLGMLVHQAAIAFELWTGVPAPLEAMRRAAARDAANASF